MHPYATMQYTNVKRKSVAMRLVVSHSSYSYVATERKRRWMVYRPGLQVDADANELRWSVGAKLYNLFTPN